MYVKSGLTRKIPNPDIQKILKLCGYVGDFFLITTQFLFAAQFHSKEVKLTPKDSAVFSVLCYNSRTVRNLRHQ